MGLPVRLALYATDELEARTAARLSFERIAALDRIMSDYRTDSELRRLEARPGQRVVVSRDSWRSSGVRWRSRGRPMARSIRQSRRWSRSGATHAATGACRRVRISTAHGHWLAFIASSSMPATHLSASRLECAWTWVASPRATSYRRRWQILRSAGVTRALVESGGDIVVGDAPPGREGWTIDVPGDDLAFRERASRLTNSALSTSGATMQFVEIDGVRYSHVIDPRTGIAVTNHTVAHVIAEDAATADALSTALAVVGHQGSQALIARFPGVLVILVP